MYKILVDSIDKSKIESMSSEYIKCPLPLGTGKQEYVCVIFFYAQLLFVRATIFQS